MGGSCVSKYTPVEHSEEGSISNWHVIGTAKPRIIDPKLPPLEDAEHIELFDLLKDPVTQKALGSFATRIGRETLLMCWAEIEELKEEYVPELRTSLAAEIYENYAKTGSPLRLATVTDAHSAKYKTVTEATLFTQMSSFCDESTSIKGAVGGSFFVELQHLCFMEIFNHIFKAFKVSEEYTGICCELKSKYNTVRTQDFDYFEALGKGTYGVVIRCRKKTTKKFYAMKVIQKQDLLRTYCSQPDMVDVEVKALAALRHPFIVSMDYSFQTPQYGFIVMELVDGGTLATVMQSFRKKVLRESHLRFYVAEIAEALHYLHGVGLTYRDLKPANVLIGMDGHVKLADLGGVTVTGGEDVIRSSSDGPQNVYATSSTSSAAPEFNIDNLTHPARRRTVFGTRGYMAPEVLELISEGYRRAKGCAYMSDWWSLGVVIYVLLTGRRPFPIPKGATPDEELEAVREGRITFEQGTTPECIELICSFLEKEDTERMGYGPNAISDIQNHPFFATFKWSQVLSRQCKPPLVPSEMDLASDPASAEHPCYDGFDELPMIDKNVEAPCPKDEEYFSDWNYVSPTTLRIEFGVANAEKQYEQNAKLRRVLGDRSAPSSTDTVATILANRISLSSWSSAATAGGRRDNETNSPFNKANSMSPPTSRRTFNFPRRKSATSVLAVQDNNHQ